MPTNLRRREAVATQVSKLFERILHGGAPLTLNEIVGCVYVLSSLIEAIQKLVTDEISGK